MAVVRLHLDRAFQDLHTVALHPLASAVPMGFGSRPLI